MRYRVLKTPFKHLFVKLYPSSLQILFQTLIIDVSICILVVLILCQFGVKKSQEHLDVTLEKTYLLCYEFSHSPILAKHKYYTVLYMYYSSGFYEY